MFEKSCNIELQGMQVGGVKFSPKNHKSLGITPMKFWLVIALSKITILKTFFSSFTKSFLEIYSNDYSTF